MYALKDVTVIIPTYNRVEDLRETLSSFKERIASLCEVLVIDQSKNRDTRQLVASMKNKKIIYFHSDVASLTAARNIGIRKTSPKSKIVLFLDDDISLGKNYFDEILRVFNENSDALGVSGYYLSSGVKMGKFEKSLRRIFCIEHKSRNDARVLSAYGAVYPATLNGTINAEWLTGFNMAFKREVFEKEMFDENLSQYALGEDFDFSYRIHLMRPNSLYITPYANLVHRVSTVERVPTRKISYMNQIYHFYFNFKNFNRTIGQKVGFAWTIFGITILRAMQFATHPTHNENLRWRYYLASLLYCLVNLNKIRKGKLIIPE